MIGVERRLTRAATQSGAYAATAVLTGLGALLATHLLIGSVGAAAWSNAVVAQAAGAIAGAIASLGWQSAGPSLVAMHRDSSEHLLLSSIKPRTTAAAAIIPLVVVTVFAMTRSLDPVLALLAVSSLMPSLGCAWYFVGLAQPTRLLQLDALPQFVGLVAGSILATHGQSLMPYAVCTTLGAALALLLSYATAFRRPTSRTPSAVLKSEPTTTAHVTRHATWTSWAGLLTSYSPLLFTAALVPAQLPVAALADRLFRFALAAFSPLLQVIQGWVPRATSPTDLAARARAAVAMGGTWGVVGGVVGILLLNDVGRVLSSDAVDVPASVVVVYAVMYLVLSIGQVTALACLVPLGDTRTLARSTAIGALVVVAFAPLFGTLFGLMGILGSVLLGEVIAVATQVLRVLDSGVALKGRGSRN